MKKSIDTSSRAALNMPEYFFNAHYEVFLRLAQQLISKVPFNPGEKVLDVGCRNGKATQILASMNPDIHFEAITTTKAFLNIIEQDETLKTLGNIKFKHKSLMDLGFKNAFDKVVSFSCLTWVEDKKTVISQIYKALKPGGRAYLQLFVDHGHHWSDTCIFEIAKRPHWQDYFNNFRRKVQHCKPEVFSRLADECGFIVEKGELAKREIPILDENYLKNWIMTWSSHLAYLPENEIDNFFSQVVSEYIMRNPKDGKGRLFYRDYFFEAVLMKPE